MQILVSNEYPNGVVMKAKKHFDHNHDLIAENDMPLNKSVDETIKNKLRDGVKPQKIVNELFYSYFLLIYL
jgi:hypothetical protein